jgi:hypothetical protein
MVGLIGGLLLGAVVTAAIVGVGLLVEKAMDSSEKTEKKEGEPGGEPQ